ncbi:hypothetical protein HSX37_14960|uniref:hypothetical protein n=1 Tax=Dendrosporobacter quercicolus TaxID=146817 RepID=UPI00156E7621|nr:hypothetical protein [Dendrosporobacter quercicolus]NSL49334.1 hypothetical protein [Dendrosporobacter quercicolus DSM 1736]
MDPVMLFSFKPDWTVAPAADIRYSKGEWKHNNARPTGYECEQSAWNSDIQ